MCALKYKEVLIFQQLTVEIIKHFYYYYFYFYFYYDYYLWTLEFIYSQFNSDEWSNFSISSETIFKPCITYNMLFNPVICKCKFLSFECKQKLKIINVSIFIDTLCFVGYYLWSIKLQLHSFEYLMTLNEL